MPTLPRAPASGSTSRPRAGGRWSPTERSPSGSARRPNTTTATGSASAPGPTPSTCSRSKASGRILPGEPEGGPMPAALSVIRDEHRSLVAVLQGLQFLVRDIRDRGVEPDFDLFSLIVDYIEIF